MFIRTLTAVGAVITVAAALLVTAAGTGRAMPTGITPSTAEVIHQQIGRAISATGQARAPSAQRGLRVSTGGGSVSVTGGNGGTVSLSTALRVGSTTTWVRASETISAAGPSFAVGAQTTADGGRLFVVMDNRSAPSRYTFNLSLPQGISLNGAPDGTVRLTAAGGRVQVRQIERPWAVDVTGKHPPTRYRIAGSSVVQTIDTVGAAYPIVADPKLTYGWSVYQNLRGTEVQSILTVFATVGSAAVLYGCVSLKRPAQILSTITLVKSLRTIAGGGAVIKAIWLTLVINANEYKKNPLQCYQKKIIPMSSGGWVKVGSGDCS